MSEPLFQSFAIVGAGFNIGIPIVKAFLAINFPILVIARPSSTAVSALPPDDPNLKVVSVDTSSVSDITKILRAHKVDVVLSTVSAITGGVSGSYPVADAAKAAGVKLFVPSEYGVKTFSEEGLAGERVKFSNYLKSISLPSLRIYNGLFHEFIPWLTCVEETGKFYIIGEGNTPVSFTSNKDVAGYIAHVLTTCAPSQLFDIELRIEGQRATISELGTMYKHRAEVVHIETLPTEGISNATIREYWHDRFNRGLGSTGFNPVTGKDDEDIARSGNVLWEGHQWLTIEEVLDL